TFSLLKTQSENQINEPAINTQKKPINGSSIPPPASVDRRSMRVPSSPPSMETVKHNPCSVSSLTIHNSVAVL
ncbi:hypothetical protein, partial [Acetobacter orleanensis]|uniref:hypothetical protein n=1 Tax=Acetobacter orleanensis TaxID=104099 RepID=UPI0022302F23